MAKSTFKIGNISITKNDVSVNLGDMSVDVEISLQELVENGKQGMQAITQLREFARSELPDVIRNVGKALVDAELDAERVRKARTDRHAQERIADTKLDIEVDNLRAEARKERTAKFEAEMAKAKTDFDKFKAEIDKKLEE